MMLCGQIENWCEEKFNEAWENEQYVRAWLYGILGGFPAGLAICGIELYILGAVAFLTGKRIGFVEK